MASEVQNLTSGQVEIVISKNYGGGAEVIQIRAVVDSGQENDFEKLRKDLFTQFINPRRAEYQKEVEDYQQAMAKLANEAENEEIK